MACRACTMSRRARLRTHSCGSRPCRAFMPRAKAWSLRGIFDKGLLVRDYRISPYCPRCGTPLSDHELGQPGGYETVTDPSVTVRFPLRDLPPGAHPALTGADLLVWTTTPWTL